MDKKEINNLPEGCSVCGSPVSGVYFFVFPGPDGTYHSFKFDHVPTEEECVTKLPKKAGVGVVTSEVAGIDPETKKVKKEEDGEDIQD